MDKIPWDWVPDIITVTIALWKQKLGVIIPLILLQRFKLLSCKELKMVEHNALVTIIQVKKGKNTTLHFLIVSDCSYPIC